MAEAFEDRICIMDNDRNYYWVDLAERELTKLVEKYLQESKYSYDGVPVRVIATDGLIVIERIESAGDEDGL